MTLLSLTASFGALVWIFQEGNLSGLLDFEPLGYTIAGNPIIMFATLIGLSMDYEVLLLSRVQEAYRRTGDNAAAVADGLARTAGVITGAALIMVTVFAAFALAETVTIKSIGVGMALAVALDATIIRVLLVPATMRLLGRWNWWAPGPLGPARRAARVQPRRGRGGSRGRIGKPGAGRGLGAGCRARLTVRAHARRDARRRGGRKGMDNADREPGPLPGTMPGHEAAAGVGRRPELRLAMGPRRGPAARAALDRHLPCRPWRAAAAGSSVARIRRPSGMSSSSPRAWRSCSCGCFDGERSCCTPARS